MDMPRATNKVLNLNTRKMTKLEIIEFIIWYRGIDKIFQRALDPSNIAQYYIEAQNQALGLSVVMPRSNSIVEIEVTEDDINTYWDENGA